MKEYTNGEIVVTFEAELCCHSGRCVHGLPEVFDVTQRPWIRLEGADTARIRRQVEQCPSKALKCRDAAPE